MITSWWRCRTEGAIPDLKFHTAGVNCITCMQVLAGAGLTDGAAVDAWSLGCILAELALKRPLFPCNSPSQLLSQVRAYCNCLCCCRTEYMRV